MRDKLEGAEGRTEGGTNCLRLAGVPQLVGDTDIDFVDMSRSLGNPRVRGGCTGQEMVGR